MSTAADFPGQEFLPDNRAWEMVSPPAKNGNDVLTDTSRIRAAASDQSLPTGLMFSSLGSFSNVDGTGNASDYVSQRTLIPGTRGWSTHNVYPLQPPLAGFANVFGGEALYVGDTSTDLTKAVFRSYKSLPGTPDEVFDATNFYLRTNLRTPGSGSYQLLSGCTFSCSIEADQNGDGLTFVGGSTDLSSVLFYGDHQLSEDAPASNSLLYKARGANLSLVGYVPPPPATQCTGVEPSCEVAPEGAVPGAAREETFAPHVISADGTRTFFTVATGFGTEGDIFMRDDRGTVAVGDDTTIQVDASERTSPEPALPATYWDANANGTRAFFVTSEALTDDAPTDTGASKLYRWSLAPDGDGHHLTYISADHEPADALASVHGTLGVSDDGNTLYFLQQGQIDPGEPVLNSRVGIYRWQPGEGVRYIGEMVDEADISDDLPGSSHRYLEDPQLGARVTPDGAHLLLSLRQAPAPGGFDHGDCPDDGGSSIEGREGCRQLYLYDAGQGSLACVSCDPDGTPPSTPAVFSVVSLPSLAISTGYLNRPITDDGRYAFFSTGESLVASDGNSTSDAYVFDTATGEARLLSSGESTSPSYFVNASASGRDAFIVTRERLSGWDFDTNRDIYDARIDGGVPEPAPVAAPCSGDSCQPPPQASSEAALDSANAGGKGAKPKGCGKQRRPRRSALAGSRRGRASKACGKKRRGPKRSRGEGR